ncbi:hypothetical protein [Martelella sp. HB161492]|uniref:hypothetical protein n=1 Tax=Martelella sp. HB161492 TaxID=2720726 RepID=UPI001591469C|nr:hypothetical protein [Martelella sp. HB161492]
MDGSSRPSTPYILEKYGNLSHQAEPAPAPLQPQGPVAPKPSSPSLREQYPEISRLLWGPEKSGQASGLKWGHSATDAAIGPSRLSASALQQAMAKASAATDMPAGTEPRSGALQPGTAQQDVMPDNARRDDNPT